MTLSEMDAGSVKSSLRRFMLDVPFARLEGVVIGGAPARTLVTLHAGPGESHEVLRPHLDALANDERCVVFYDQRGGGASALTAGSQLPTFDDHVADAHRVSASFGEQVDVLGFSFGALIALGLALRAPELLRSLVLVSPAPISAYRHPETERRLRRASERPEVLRFTALLADPAFRPELTHGERAFFARVAPFLSEPGAALRLSPVACNEAARASVFDSLGRYDFSSELDRLRGCRSVVLCGREDPTPLVECEALAQRLGARFACLDCAGHAPFAEQNAEFLRLVSTFLDEAR